MRTVTHEEIQASMDLVHAMTENEMQTFVTDMQKEQPYIQLYVAAICERGDFDDENDADAFVNLSGIIWHAMRHAAAGPLNKVEGHEIDKWEEKTQELYDYAEGESEADWPATVQAWLDGCNQRPLLESLLGALISPENPYAVTGEGTGIIFTHLRVIIECLDNAEQERRV